MSKELEAALAALKNQERRLTDLIKEMVGRMEDKPEVRAIDIYSMAVVNRALALINGYDVMVRSNNYHGAVHLVRLHLDSLLRYAALWMVDDPNEFVRAVMNGVRVNTLKDKEGKKMLDSRLRDVVALDYPWVTNVYDQTSGFVHFSKKHIALSTMVTDRESGQVQHAIGREDRFVRDETRLEATEGMVAITGCIADYLGYWTATKHGPSRA